MRTLAPKGDLCDGPERERGPDRRRPGSGSPELRDQSLAGFDNHEFAVTLSDFVKQPGAPGPRGQPHQF